MPFPKGRPPTAVEFDELLSHMTSSCGRSCAAAPRRATSISSQRRVRGVPGDRGDL